ncbi:MAG TPA: hypothetical protein P5560_04360 [Thermotogota bacterium]|nr:hypothetical protein [Thermotogota bacterium]HRW92166.1 hypothetical protein [Thermotogota bacterium]
MRQFFDQLLGLVKPWNIPSIEPRKVAVFQRNPGKHGGLPLQDLSVHIVFPLQAHPL